MSKLIPMEEAAKILGMSVEKLNELRSNNEVFGYRDGSTWKFKMSELERVADDMGLSISPVEGAVDVVKGALELSGDKDESAEFDLDLEESSEDLFFEPDSDSIAMADSSVELFRGPLGAKDGGTSSDILVGGGADEEDEEDVIDLAESGLLIKTSSKDQVLDDGGTKKGIDAVDVGSSLDFGLDDSIEDLKLEKSSDDLKLQDSGDSFKLVGESGELNIAEDAEGELSFGSSSIDLASESKKSQSPSSTGDDVLGGEPSSGAPSTGKLVSGDGNLADDDLFDDELDLADSASFESSEISNDFDDSSDLVLADNDSSGELTLEANESGIELSANESGIALGEEPLELGGSDIDELELPEDDDIILIDDAADADSATLMQEDDFNLTPDEMSLDDDDDSSGSQVIALAESEIYTDDSTATVLGEGGLSGEQSFVGDDFYDPAAAAMTGAGVAGVAGAAAMAPQESAYTKWQVAALTLTALVLFLGTIVAYGTAQNLWIPDDQVVKSGLMKLFIDSLGMN